MEINFKSILKYAAAIIGFVIISLAYFNPVLQGKTIFQSDIAQYVGMAKELIDFRETANEETYWTNRGFGGMPTYLLGAKYPHHYVKKIDSLLRFLPRPADYIFLYFLGFFILLTVLKVDTLLAFIGSLAFGFSTYFIIILGVGHNAKAHAIGYMPMVLAGVLLVFNKKYIRGGLLFCIAMALELAANHYQMTYYLMLMICIVGAVFLYQNIKTKELASFGKSAGVLLSGLVLAIAMNATAIFAAKEYSAFSTRGKSEITITEKGETKTAKGLDKDYILAYSYGVLETMNLMFPRFMGGASYENIGDKASIVKALVKEGYPYQNAKEIAKSAPTYWGDQPIVAGPAYIGATLIFLFVLGLFTYKGAKKTWIVITVLLALALSWGKNLNVLSSLFIDYFPLYDKFRAITSIQVLIELCVPFFGIYTLYQFLQRDSSEKIKLQDLYKAVGVCVGVGILFLVAKSAGLISFTTQSDLNFLKSPGRSFLDALKEDRARIFTTDIYRSIGLVVLIAAALWGYVKQKISRNVAVIGIGLLFLVDLVPVAWRYVNNDSFVRESQVSGAFKATQADKLIQQDTSQYRVYDITRDPFNSARNSYFHNAVGGYHAAKPQRMQQLYEFYLSKGTESVLDMLNVKYFMFSDEKGQPQVQRNDTALGNAWFVADVTAKATANDEILSLEKLDVASKAVVSENELLSKKEYAIDTLANIKLTKYLPNKIEYKSENTKDGFAVFSEMYYKNGWKAFVDGKETNIFKTNYVLRGIEIPKGSHDVTFVFDPQVVKTGSLITLIASLCFVILSIFGVRYILKEK